MAERRTVELTPRDRIRGCLIGGAIGDALGAGIEFDSLSEIRAEHGPAGLTGYVPEYGRLGAITDDTQMTIFTVEGLIRGGVRRDKGIGAPHLAVWNAYQRWLITQGVTPVRPGADQPPSWLLDEPVLHHRRAPGNTCLTGLQRSSPDDPLPTACLRSKGCGTVMRSAPFGLIQAGPHWTARMAIESSGYSHGHPTAGHSAAALSLIVEALVRGLPMAEAVAESVAYLKQNVTGAHETLQALDQAVTAARLGPASPEQVEALGGGWVAEEALAIAVYCALATDDVRTALLAAVNHSGDSDSTGAVCGNLLGAALGDEALPLDWAADVEARGILLQLADDLYFEFYRGGELHGEWGPDTSWPRRYPPV